MVEDVFVQWGDGGSVPGEDHESVIKALMRLDMQSAVQVRFQLSHHNGVPYHMTMMMNITV